MTRRLPPGTDPGGPEETVAAAADRKLKVLMASTSYPRDEQDWRGVFIRNMTWALARRKDVVLRSWCPPGPLPANVGSATDADDDDWLDQLSRAGGIAHLLRAGNPLGAWRGLQLMRRLRAMYLREMDADLVHANWLQLALPLPSNGKPLLATVLGTDFKLLGIPGMVAALRNRMSGRPVAICPNAEWMVPQLERQFGDLARVRYVPLGIQDEYFSLQRTAAAPRRWLCVSRLTDAKIGDLFRWGEAVFRGQDRELHLFGPMQERVQVPDWVVYHGPVSQRDLLATWFPCAAGLISLSRHSEGRPQVMLEAMAAGLPIIASDMEAHRELVEPHGAGLICRAAGDLGAALEAMESAAGVAAGENARATAARLYGTWDDCARRYAELYRQLSRP